MNDKLKHLICGFLISVVACAVAIFFGAEMPLSWGFGLGILAAFAKEIYDNVRMWINLDGTPGEKIRYLLKTTLRDSGFDLVATVAGAWIGIVVVYFVQGFF